MWKIFQKIKRWILSKQFLFEEETSIIRSVSIVQENSRDAQTRKRVAKAFKEQEKQMQTRAMKAHGADCKDPLTCKKRICYKWEPDKIIAKDE